MNLFKKISSYLKRGLKLDEEFFVSLEEKLVEADVGILTCKKIVNKIREEVRKHKLVDSTAIIPYVKKEILDILSVEREINFNSQLHTILVIGVNGTGKTTTIAKLANYYKGLKKDVLLACCDTYRAASFTQLGIWADRLNVGIVKGASGADPGAVAYDAVESAFEKKNILIIDTAGRQHTKYNLMEELKKIKRVLAKKIEGAPAEVLLVLDATTGQNALSQARLFTKNLDVTGIVIAKLDGTAKGGIVIAIADELKIPIRYIGIGEGVEDFNIFNKEKFVDSIFE